MHWNTYIDDTAGCNAGALYGVHRCAPRVASRGPPPARTAPRRAAGRRTSRSSARGHGLGARTPLQARGSGTVCLSLLGWAGALIFAYRTYTCLVRPHIRPASPLMCSVSPIISPTGPTKPHRTYKWTYGAHKWTYGTYMWYYKPCISPIGEYKCSCPP